MFKKIIPVLTTSILLLSTQSAFTAPIISNGLIGAWDFSGNANDSSGNNNHGTVYNATLTTDRFGNNNSAYSFNGSNSFIEIGHPIPTELKPTNAFTISAWVNASGYSNAHGGVVGGIVASQWDPTQSGYSMQIDYRNSAHGGTLGGVHFQVGDGYYWTTGGEGTTNTAIPLNDWTHVVAVADTNSQYKVYLDGLLVADWTAQADLGYSNLEHLLIGKNFHGHGDNRHFDGSIDDVAIYDRALSATEVGSLFNTTTQVSSPASAFLFGLGLLGLSGSIARKKNSPKF